MQTVARHDIEEVVYGQPAEHGRFEMIRRDEVLLPAAWGKEQRGCRVVSPVCEELQGEEGMRRSALAQIKLNRIWRPRAVARPHYDKVDRKPAQHPLTGQALADPLRIRADHLGVFEICRERTPRV